MTPAVGTASSAPGTPASRKPRTTAITTSMAGMRTARPKMRGVSRFSMTCWMNSRVASTVRKVTKLPETAATISGRTSASWSPKNGTARRTLEMIATGRAAGSPVTVITVAVPTP